MHNGRVRPDAMNRLRLLGDLAILNNLRRLVVALGVRHDGQLPTAPWIRKANGPLLTVESRRRNEDSSRNVVNNGYLGRGPPERLGEEMI